MTRLAFTFSALLALAAGACGGGGDDDDATGNGGFVKPASPCVAADNHPCQTGAITEAFSEINGVWTSQGPADWSCLNTPSSDTPSTTAITLTGLVDDFQTGDPVPAVSITAFHDIDLANPIATGTSDDNGNYTMTLPVGVERVGFDMTAEGQMRTLLLNQYFDPATSDQSHDMSSVSVLTTQALSAFIGVTRTPGRGVVAGAMRDCNDNEVANAIATVTMAPATTFAEAVDGFAWDETECTRLVDDAELPPCTQTYYFSAGSSSLPVQRSLAPYTNKDGLFMTIELPAVSGAYLQVWGFRDGDDTAGDPALLAQIPTPVMPDVVVTFSLEPLRTQ